MTGNGQEGWSKLLADAVAAAETAMMKYPQPNYVISKVAEESGEVVKAAIHCAEGRETFQNLRGEMVQTIAMLYRLWIEGDQVHGLPAVSDGIAAEAASALGAVKARARKEAVSHAIAWTNTSDSLPQKPGVRDYEQIECLIRMPNGDIVIAMWNCEHECWDDADGDDYRFDPTTPTHWLAMTSIRAALEGGE